MSKTIDDLMLAYEREFCLAPTDRSPRRAGVTAIVKALRDEIAFTNDNCGVCVSTRRIFNEILGDAGEKVGGGEDSPKDRSPATDPAPTVGQRLIKAAHEAAAIARGDMQPGRVYTDPAPAACVWKKGQRGGVTPSCSDLYEYAPYVVRKGVCPECKAPIKFTEAKT